MESEDLKKLKKDALKQGGILALIVLSFQIFDARYVLAATFAEKLQAAQAQKIQYQMQTTADLSILKADVKMLRKENAEIKAILLELIGK